MIAPPTAPSQVWSVGLAAALRAEGIVVGTGQVIACERALGVLDPTDRWDRYAAGRSCLLSDPAHLAIYDRVFALFDGFPAHSESGVAPGPPPTPSGPDAGSDRAGGPDGHERGVVAAGAVATERERLRARRFDELTDDERVRILRMLDQLRVALPRRSSRRLEAATRGLDLDLPRTLDRAIETDGELVDRRWRRRTSRPRRLVVLLDVSGSMAGHARVMLRFAAAAARTVRHDPSSHVEVFAFATRLTRLSHALSVRDPDRAISAAAERVADWDGGTRIGASIDTLVRRWGPRGVLRGAVVVICSDGLERGEPEGLATALARLRRHAYRLVWVNPLAGGEGYAPTQRGMAAARPYLDVFLPGNTLADLEELAATLRALR